MKKFTWLAAMFLLVGCTAGGDSEESSSVSETVESTSSMVEESDTAEVADTTTESLPEEESSEESRGTGAGGQSSSDTATSGETGGTSETGEALTLYIPTALRESEGTELYNEVIGVAEDFTTTNANLGEEELFTLSYTGYFIENEDGPLQAFFMGINRVGTPLTNLSFTLNFLVGEEAVWENTVFTLYEDEFGEQPVNTAMPIFLDVPAGKEELLKGATPEQSFIEIFDLEVE